MVDRAIILKDAYQSMCQNEPKLEAYALEDDEWTYLEKLRCLLSQFETMTKTVSSSVGYPTINRAMSVYNAMIDTLEEFIEQETNPSLLRAAIQGKQKLLDYYSKTDSTPVYAVATAMDPRMRFNWWSANDWDEYIQISKDMVADDNIARLMREMARLQNKVATLEQQQQPEQQDPTITAQVPYTTYHPTDDEVIQYPALKPDKPIDFFLKNKITDTEFKDLFRKYPRNAYMGHYTAPKIPKVITNNNSNDIDPESMLDVSINFAVLIRDQLGGLAGKMHEACLGNVRAASGITEEDDDLNMVDATTLHEEVKSSRTLATAFNKNGSDLRQGRGGNFNSAQNSNNNSNNNNNHSHGSGSSNWRNNNQDR
ncbi:hypothetical protein BGZ59_002653 [Podila verticillata]|nr:hypothetical protein BGZ59_002653 [Podila verticillata]